MSDTREAADKAWYLVQCKVRQESRAEENLLLQSYVCYHPKLTRERVLRGQRKIVEESLFPGYLFIQLSQQDSWAPIRSTRGVSRIVSFGGKPIALGDDLIERLRLHEHASGPREHIVVGEKVLISDGPFVDLEAIFLEMNGNDRVVLLLNFLQREHKILMPLTGVRKL
ncbi:transcription/translation regulatory transformer protein RfaH [Pseudomonas sp. TCU-HL1]|uniref:transcription/translation regulatory transformer protein RfaH n=1 Tax=Pseudomonas sp. TCU-HL1 TaxID=1856685 RepID=UPI00083DF903|nr:transcription/translation regulatory transformer protein RfaH [Pseudomonas sp. TCU-HL1]